MGAHAFLAPSFAPVWGHCSAAPWMLQQFPKPDTAQTLEGTAVHWGAAECLQAWKSSAVESDLSCVDYVGQTTDNGLLFTDEMAEIAQVYVDDVVRVCSGLPQGLGNLFVEQHVAMPQIHPTDNDGTLDAGVFIPEQALLVLWDLKAGFSPVEAFENLQLADYALGLLNLLGVDGYAEQFISVEFRIVQPRNYHGNGPVSVWRTPATTLRGLWNRLQDQAHQVYYAPTMTVGAHCKNCPGAGVCGASRRHVYTLRDFCEQPYEVDNMTEQDLGAEYTIVKEAAMLAAQRADALEEEIEHRIANGKGDTGYTKQAKSSALKWGAEVTPAQVQAVCSVFGVNALKDEARTPSQVLALADPSVRDLLAEQINALTMRTHSSKLIRAEDTIVSRAFKNKQ